MSRVMLTREEFWRRFARVGTCLVWTGARNAEGYGAVKVSGVLCAVHTLAWETYHGKPVPPGMLVRHKCDNPPCGEPSHLELGDHGDNLRDQWHRKRRRARTKARRSEAQP